MRKFLIVAAVALAGCSLSPKFEVPKTDAPSAFREEGVKELGKWKAAEPLAEADRGQWWKIFKDKKLDALEQQAAEANQTLKAAAARVEEARGIAGAGRADVLPNVTLGGNAVRAASSAAAAGAPSPQRYTLYDAAGVASWEPDFFGRVREEHRALVMTAEAQQAAYNNALLSLQADVAQNYFALRAIDAERQLVRRAVKVRAEAARIMNSRLKEGEAGEQDASRAEGELQAARADLTALDRRRAALEHALAVLLGQVPSAYKFPESPLKGAPPRVPAGLPSGLLTRRPDIGQALGLMAAANARIGAAKAAYFPDVSLTASGGFQAASFGNLFEWSSRAWALGQVAGLALQLPIFDNGRRGSALDAARARYDIALAEYRQAVLNAFRDVEDNLADQRLLASQSRQQDAAAGAASRTTAIARRRYEEGDADYFEVVDADRVSLAAGRAAVQVRGQRYITAVTLIRALGGGWDNAAAPAPAMSPKAPAGKPKESGKK